CILKITKMHISECQEPFGIKDEGITIDLAAYSSAYPIDLSINNRPIHQLSDDRMYSFTLPLVQNDSDTNILTISNPEGCRLEYPLHHPCSSPTLDFPNAFTPNGDGHNDIWMIQLPEGSEVINCVIYNKWGE